MYDMKWKFTVWGIKNLYLHEDATYYVLQVSIEAMLTKLFCNIVGIFKKYFLQLDKQTN